MESPSGLAVSMAGALVDPAILVSIESVFHSGAQN